MSDEELKKVANEVRKGIVTGVHAAKSGHPGGSLGAADIMTYLYFEEMNVDPAIPARPTAIALCFPRATVHLVCTLCSPSVGSSPRRILRRCATSAATCRVIPT